MTRGDRVVIAVVAALALLAWPVSVLAAGGFSTSRAVVITAPGGTVATTLDGDRTIAVRGLRGELFVRVEAGTVRVVSSPCPDQLCVHAGAISSGAIVCAPEGVSVRVGGDPDAPDAVIR